MQQRVFTRYAKNEQITWSTAVLFPNLLTDASRVLYSIAYKFFKNATNMNKIMIIYEGVDVNKNAYPFQNKIFALNKYTPYMQ